MSLTSRKTWTLVHGLVIGSVFLLAFGGGWPASGASSED
jgi:hypothetical protein